jgi:hypothetical protein
MPIKRATHGCSRVTNNNIDYMIVLGGTNYYSIYNDILYYNIVQKKWENTILLPERMASIQAVISTKLDSEGCDMMILYNWPVYKLYICRGHYDWLSVDTTGLYDQYNQFAIVGANELLPCGIDG